MPRLYRDYETRSTLDLKKVGAGRYAAHPSTDVWCCAYAVDDGPVELWTPSEPIPAAFVKASQNPDWTVNAFNAGFERATERHIMGPRYGWPLAPIERQRCEQAAALALALPAKLEKAAAALGLPAQKDLAGAKVMREMSAPRKPVDGEDPLGVYWHDDPERRARLGVYCRQDVEIERALHARVGDLSPA